MELSEGSRVGNGWRCLVHVGSCRQNFHEKKQWMHEDNKCWQGIGLKGTFRALYVIEWMRFKSYMLTAERVGFIDFWCINNEARKQEIALVKVSFERVEKLLRCFFISNLIDFLGLINQWCPYRVLVTVILHQTSSLHRFQFEGGAKILIIRRGWTLN